MLQCAKAPDSGGSVRNRLIIVSWRDVADRGVKPHGVVVFDEGSDQATGVLKVQGDAWADAISLKRFVPAFDFPVALRVIGRSAHMA